jgi:hypothetical protein
MIHDPHHISDVSSAVWQRYTLTPVQAAAGRHTVQIILKRRHPQLACDLVLTDVEVMINW